MDGTSLKAEPPKNQTFGKNAQRAAAMTAVSNLQSQLARQEEHGRKEQHAGDQIDGLQRAKIAVREDPQELRRADVDRESGRMRMMAGDIEGAHAETEERLVPVPDRAGHRQKTSGGGDERDGPEDGPLSSG